MLLRVECSQPDGGPPSLLCARCVHGTQQPAQSPLHGGELRDRLWASTSARIPPSCENGCQAGRCRQQGKKAIGLHAMAAERLDSPVRLRCRIAQEYAEYSVPFPIAGVTRTLTYRERCGSLPRRFFLDSVQRLFQEVRQPSRLVLNTLTILARAAHDARHDGYGQYCFGSTKIGHRHVCLCCAPASAAATTALSRPGASMQ